MPAKIKAIVFKTPQLNASRVFFESVLKRPVNESSERHFVIYSKNIRLVFVESTSGFDVEMYLKGGLENAPEKLLPDSAIPGFESYTDPNGIRIIVSRHP
jgi:hypothetical protein